MRGLGASTPLLSIALCMLLLGSNGAVISAQAQDPDQFEEPLRSLKGNLALRVYPNGTVKARVAGGLEQALGMDETRLPVASATFELSVMPNGFNLTALHAALVVKPDPRTTLVLSGLTLDVRIHGEENWGDASVDFELVGLLAANGTIHTTYAGEGLGGQTSLHLTLKLWYGEGTLGNEMGISKELVEDFVTNFDIYTEVLQELVTDYSDGNVTLRELTLEHADLSEAYGTLTVRAEVEGDYAKAFAALASAFGPPETDLGPVEGLTELLAEARSTRMVSTDLLIIYERVQQEFRVEYTGIFEGDVDRELNGVKNAYLAYLDEVSPEIGLWMTYTGLGEFLPPTNLSVRNLHASFEYHSSDATHGFTFTVEGFSFQPPTPEAMLPFLRDVSFRTPIPGLNLTLEGGSDEQSMVEIRIAESVARPLTADSHRAVWAFANLTDFEDVRFEVKPNSWAVADFNVQTEKATIAGTQQPVVFVTNSTLVATPEVTEDHITVTVEGPSGSKGAMNLTMPVTNGVIKVTVNGASVEPHIATNGTHYFIYLQYSHSVDTIHVVWPTPTLTMTISKEKIEAGQSITVTGSLNAAGEPLANIPVGVVVDGQLAGTALTNTQGGYSYSQELSKAGTHAIKAVLRYYEKSFESAQATVIVETPLLQRPEVLAGLAAVVVVVILAAYVLARRGRGAAQTPS